MPLSASPMLSSRTRKMSVNYYHGDRISVLCPSSGSCSLLIRTNKKNYRYSSSEIGAELSPTWVRLFSYPRNGANYFTFYVSVYCSETASGDDDDCFASGTVQDGELTSIEIIQRTVQYK